MAPFGRATLGWDVTMPTTVLPGVHVDVHLYGVGNQAGDQIVEPQGHEVVMPYADNTYAITLRTPLAWRELGTVELTVDLGSCTSVDTAPAVVIEQIKGPAVAAFPGGGQVTLRSDPTVDIGINSFVVVVPLTASVPDWFDADIDVSLGFDIVSDHGSVRVINGFASTNVWLGWLSGVLSAGCSAAVSTALEAMSDSYLSGFVGPVIAGQIGGALVANINDNLYRLNHSTPPPAVPYRYYDLILTQDGMTYHFCPAHPANPVPPPPIVPPVDPGSGGVIIGQ